VEDTYPQGGGVTLDRGGVVHWLERIRELEEELDRFRHVFHLAGGGVDRVVPQGTSSIDRWEVRRSCTRATVSRPDRSVNMGERILSRRPEIAGTEATRRNSPSAVSVLSAWGRERNGGWCQTVPVEFTLL
jgi:hypothetical protein